MDWERIITIAADVATILAGIATVVATIYAIVQWRQYNKDRKEEKRTLAQRRKTAQRQARGVSIEYRIMDVQQVDDGSYSFRSSFNDVITLGVTNGCPRPITDVVLRFKDEVIDEWPHIENEKSEYRIPSIPFQSFFKNDPAEDSWRKQLKETRKGEERCYNSFRKKLVNDEILPNLTVEFNIDGFGFTREGKGTPRFSMD